MATATHEKHKPKINTAVQRQASSVSPCTRYRVSAHFHLVLGGDFDSKLMRLPTQDQLPEPKRPLPSLALQDQERYFDKLVEHELVNFVQYLEDVADDGGADGDDEDMQHYVQIRRSWAKSLDATLGRVDYGLLAVLEWIVNWYTVYKPNEKRNRSEPSIRFKGMCLTASISTIRRQLHMSRPAVRHNLAKLASLKLIRIENTENDMGYRIEVEPGNLERLYHGLPLSFDTRVPMEFFDQNPHSIEPGCRMSGPSKNAPDRVQQGVPESSSPLAESITDPARVQQTLLESVQKPARVQHQLPYNKPHATLTENYHQKLFDARLQRSVAPPPQEHEPSAPAAPVAEEPDAPAPAPKVASLPVRKEPNLTISKEMAAWEPNGISAEGFAKAQARNKAASWEKKKKKAVQDRIDSLRKELKVPTWRPHGERSESEVLRLLEEAKAELAMFSAPARKGKRPQQKQVSESEPEVFNPELEFEPEPEPVPSNIPAAPQKVPPCVLAARRSCGYANPVEQDGNSAAPNERVGDGDQNERLEKAQRTHHQTSARLAGLGASGAGQEAPEQAEARSDNLQEPEASPRRRGGRSPIQR